MGKPTYASIAILELGEKSGFSSRTSFFRAFKEQVGMSPSEYIQQKTKTYKK